MDFKDYAMNYYHAGYIDSWRATDETFCAKYKCRDASGNTQELVDYFKFDGHHFHYFMTQEALYNA